MKKLLLLFTLLITSLTFSQKNLELNQVLNVELTSEGVTVPEGKTWKIEAMHGNFFNTSGYSYLIINDEDIPINFNYNILPLWFPTGTVFKKPIGNNSYYVKYLSVLEFNLVPISSSAGSPNIEGINPTGGFNFEEIIEVDIPQIDVSNQTLQYKRIGEITVPQGKVWKIIGLKSATIGESSDGSISVNDQSGRLRIGDYPVPQGYYGASGNSGDFTFHTLLYSEGTYGIFRQGSSYAEKIKVIQYSVN